ncbi:hypothetical protein ACF3DV_19355 [Chlorogloeopsis fritschii PCC 9212]|uniref:hypothetical protein n=1 Tax=Chlorogloeopsis fritschii TaxID=1124 RepID=UPI0002F2E58D|nr:hypothetical protein [Chlorogloeopsis fritschii]
MFNIGDYVINQKTGNLGKVIGYGHQILSSGYETTLKVLVAKSAICQKKGFLEEDLYSQWLQCQ